jgi:hypothetical protein
VKFVNYIEKHSQISELVQRKILDPLEKEAMFDTKCQQQSFSSLVCRKICGAFG